MSMPAVLRTSARAVPVRPVRRNWPLFCCGTAALAASLVAYWVSVWRQPRYFSMIDTRVYLAGARVLLRGGRLYAMHATGAHLQFTYPPATAVLFSWMPVVGLWWTKVASVTLSQVALIGCVWLTLRWLQVSRRTSWGLTGLSSAALLWLEPVQATLHFGQINLLVAVLVLADLARWPRWIPPGLLIGVATGLKLVPGIFIVYLVLAGRGRAALAAAAAFLGTVALGFAVTPMQASAYWTRFAFDTGRVGSVSHVSNQSLFGLLARIAGGAGDARAAWLAVAVLVGVGGVTVAAALYRSGDAVIGGLACACTGLLVSPVSWNHHWVWAAPIAIALGHRAGQRHSWWWALALGCWLAVFGSGIIWHVPRSFGREYHWSGWQLLAGNAYVLAGLLFLGVLAARALRRQLRPPLMPPRR